MVSFRSDSRVSRHSSRAESAPVPGVGHSRPPPAEGGFCQPLFRQARPHIECSTRAIVQHAPVEHEQTWAASRLTPWRRVKQRIGRGKTHSPDAPVTRVAPVGRESRWCNGRWVARTNRPKRTVNSSPSGRSKRVGLSCCHARLPHTALAGSPSRRNRPERAFPPPSLMGDSCRENQGAPHQNQKREESDDGRHFLGAVRAIKGPVRVTWRKGT
jgi:hypothetical protein